MANGVVKEHRPSGRCLAWVQTVICGRGHRCHQSMYHVTEATPRSVLLYAVPRNNPTHDDEEQGKFPGVFTPGGIRYVNCQGRHERHYEKCACGAITGQELGDKVKAVHDRALSEQIVREAGNQDYDVTCPDRCRVLKERIHTEMNSFRWIHIHLLST